MGAMTLVWQGLSWFLTLASARYLLPSDYGVLALAETFTPYLSLLATLSVSSWLIQEASLSRHDIHAASLFSSFLSALVAVFSFLLCPLVADFYDDPSLVTPFRLICLVFLLRGLSAVPDAYLRRELRFKELSVLQLVVVLSRGSLQLALAVLGYGFWSLVIGMLAGETVTALATIYLARESLRWSWDKAVWRRIVQFGVPASLSTVYWVVFTSADNVIVGKFFGKEMLGTYAMAYYLANLPMSKINTMFRSVAFSYLARLKDQPALFQTKSLELNRVFCLLIFPVLGGMALVADLAIPLLFGSRWQGLVLPLQVLSFSALFRVVVDSLPALLSAKGQAVRAMHTQLLPAIVLPIGFLVGVYTLGINGIFAAWLFLFPLVMLGEIAMCQRELGIRASEYLWNLFSPTICTIFMALAVFLAQFFLVPIMGLTDIPALILEILLGAVSYSLILFRFFPEDAQRFLRFFVQRKSAEGALA